MKILSNFVHLVIKKLRASNLKIYPQTNPSFGSVMNTRNWSASSYRYGFNGKEKDNEISVDGGSYDFGARIYDGRLGRWLSIDPLQAKYPSVSSYCFVTNSPLQAVDPGGKDVIFLIDKDGADGQGHMAMLIQDSKGAWYFFQSGLSDKQNTLLLLTNKGYPGFVSVTKMTETNNAGDIINMTKEQAIEKVTAGYGGASYEENLTLKTSKEQDDKILFNSNKLSTDFENGKQEYRLISNNCSDLAKDAVEGNNKGDKKTDITLPVNYDTPKPNDYFNKLETSMPFLNGEKKLEVIPSKMDNYPSKLVPVDLPAPSKTPEK